MLDGSFPRPGCSRSAGRALGASALLFLAAVREHRAGKGWTAAAFVLAIGLHALASCAPPKASPWSMWGGLSVARLGLIVGGCRGAACRVFADAPCDRPRARGPGGRAEIAAMVAHEVRGPVGTMQRLGRHVAHPLRPARRRRATRVRRHDRAGVRAGCSSTVDQIVARAEDRRRAPSTGPIGSPRPREAGAPRAWTTSTSATTRVDVDSRTGRRAPDRPPAGGRGRPTARRQRREVLAAGRPDRRHRARRRGRRATDRGGRAGARDPAGMREQVFEKFSRWRPDRLRGAAGLRARPLHLPRDRRRTHGDERPSSTVPMGVPCSAFGSRGRLTRPASHAPSAADLRRPQGAHRCAGDGGRARRGAGAGRAAGARARRRRSTCARSSCPTSC